jgi:murein L,D-transpeptidase YafK
LKKSLALFLLLPILLLSSGCSLWPNLKKISVQTVEAKRIIPLQNSPRPVDMNNMHFWVVTEQNYEEFKTKFSKKNGSLSVRDYENLALNMAEIKRYIEQQKEIIIYYENAITFQQTGKKPEKKLKEIKE